ncbi:hypothetical protein KIPB_016262, partial [Kipferlia bialata]|eukprot:g16262.t1
MATMTPMGNHDSDGFNDEYGDGIPTGWREELLLDIIDDCGRGGDEPLLMATPGVPTSTEGKG